VIGLLGAIAPEPTADAKAQVAAVADPRSSKDAAFFPRGHAVPKVPAGLIRVDRPEGTLVTNHGGNAAQFQHAPILHDRMMADMLGYQDSKPDIMRGLAGGVVPTVVQGVTPKGAVAHEEAVGPRNLMQAVNTARAATPGGRVRAITLRDAIARRMMGGA